MAIGSRPTRPSWTISTGAPSMKPISSSRRSSSAWLRPVSRAASGPPRPRDGARMPTVATYNVHGCIGGDGRLDPERVAIVIRELDADIVALQEVDAGHRRGGFLDQWAYLGAAAGYHSIPGIS